MNRLLLNTIGFFLLVLIGLAGWAVWEVGNAAKALRPTLAAATPVVTQVGTTVTKFGGIADGVNQTLATVNRGCGGGHPCGTLADFAKTLNTARRAIGQIEVAANHENKRLTVLDKQEEQLYQDAHKALANLITLEVTLNTTVGGIQDLETKMGLELDALHKATLDADALITDQDLKDMILHANGVAEHLDLLSGDIQSKTHELIYPAPCHGKTCWVKRSYSIVKGIVQLGEPTYYWGSLATDVFK